MQRAPHPPTLERGPLEEDEDASSFVARLGATIGGGVLAAVVSSLPAVLRIGDGGSVLRAFEQWLALAALLTPLAIVVVAVLRRGRVGLRMVAGDRGVLFAAAALWWAVLELGILSVVGTVLRAKTHHHGLAGVTFAFAALASGLVVALLATRGVRMLLRMPRGGHRVALVVAASAALVVIVLVGVRTSGAQGLHTAAAIVDGLALVACSAIASTRTVTRWKPLAVAGTPVAAVVLLLGFACLRVVPELKDALAQAAPIEAWIVGLF